MKKLAIACLCILPLAGCTSLKDALALLASLRDETGLVEDWKATVIGTLPEDSPDLFVQRGASETPRIDQLGLEIVMVELSNGAKYPLICPAEMTKRCQSFSDGTKVFVNKGQVVDCNVYRNGILYGTCVAATELRQEM